MALIDTLAQFLCRDHVSECMNSVQQQSPDPIVQLTFLAFFPSVFLILLIYFMSGAIIREGEHKGLRTLLGVAVYLFIIFYGWYHFALIISKFWFVSLIILGGIGIFVHKMTGGGGGGGGGLRSAGVGGGGVTGTIGGYVGKRIRAKLSGEEEDIKGAIKREFSFLGGLKKQLLDPNADAKGKAYAFARAAESVGRLGGYIHNLDELHSIGTIRLSWNEIRGLKRKLDRIIKDIGMNK